jgi:hypothetical protein
MVTQDFLAGVSLSMTELCERKLSEIRVTLTEDQAEGLYLNIARALDEIFPDAEYHNFN